MTDHVRSTNPPWAAMAAFTLLANCTASSPSYIRTWKKEKKTGWEQTVPVSKLNSLFNLYIKVFYYMQNSAASNAVIFLHHQILINMLSCQAKAFISIVLTGLMPNTLRPIWAELIYFRLIWPKHLFPILIELLFVFFIHSSSTPAQSCAGSRPSAGTHPSSLWAGLHPG